MHFARFISRQKFANIYDACVLETKWRCMLLSMKFHQPYTQLVRADIDILRCRSSLVPNIVTRYMIGEFNVH